MFQIVTDSSANLPSQWLKSHGVLSISFLLELDGVEYSNIDNDSFDHDGLYASLSKGKRCSTSQISPGRYTDFWRGVLESGADILYIGMSSGISGSYGSSTAASLELQEEFPERRIFTVDSRSASLGEGLLVMRAVEMRDAGMTIQDIRDALLQLRKKMFQIFMVGDLRQLRRGGRLSGAEAIVGTVLQVKPILKGDPSGKIVLHHKVRGTRQAVESLARCYEERVVDPGKQTVGIAYTDCPENADMLARLLVLHKPPREILTVQYEPVTGSHLGTGSLALFFQGDDEVRKS